MKGTSLTTLVMIVQAVLGKLEFNNPTDQCGGLPLVVGCDNDCQQQHGAISGQCNLNNMCACHYPGDKLEPLPTDTTPPPAPLSVDHIPVFQFCEVDDRSSNNGVIYNAYTLLCNIDCQCIHGALGGYCDFKEKVCHCKYNNTDTYSNINSGNCEYCTVADVVKVINSLQTNIAAAQAAVNQTSIGGALAGVDLDNPLLPTTCP